VQIGASRIDGRQVSRGRFESRFYLGASFAFLILVFWTFARTYYLRGFFQAAPLPGLLEIHGLVMSGWVVLLLSQSGLVAIRRVQWHRRLGWIGAGWAGLVVLMGSTTTIHAAAREVRAHSAMAGPLTMIMGLELVQMLLFAGLVVVAIWCRRRHLDIHKRLMLLTIACMLPSALARLPVSFMTNTDILLGLYGFVLVCAALDTVRHRRLHPAFGWGGGIVLAALQITFVVVHTPAWIQFGRRLLS
jgi:hypothetical protein